MLLLIYLSMSMAYAASNQFTTNENYAVQINDHTLTSVWKTDELSNILDLSGRSLRSIEQFAFHDLINVKNLNLSNNEFETLRPSTFSSLCHLEHLSLTKNNLKNFESAFKCLGKLKTLDISNNPINYLEKSYLEGLKCSADIRVSPKSIWSINTAVFDDPEAKDPKSTDERDNGMINDRADRVGERRKRSTADFTGLRVKLCSNEGEVVSLEVMKNDEILVDNCKEVEVDHESQKVSLREMGISRFANNWYRLEDFPIDILDISRNEIIEVTSELLNGLPENLKDVSLAENKIERLKVGIIDNKNLRFLNFWKNSINEIDDDAFVNTRLVGLYMTGNRLRNTRFVATLPSTLSVIGLSQNEIVELSANSFARLDKLVHVNFDENKIKKLETESLRGLSSLESLRLQHNRLEKIEIGSFQDLRSLTVLSLDWNNLTSIGRGTFDGLKSIDRISIMFNKLTKFRKSDLHGISDTLRDLHLDNNAIESLGTETFINVPKRILSLRYNGIRNIERGSLNLTNLEILDLDDNLLEVLESGWFENLGKLRRLSLRKNNITEIVKGAAKGLGDLNIMDISDNPLEILANGALYGLPKSAGTHISLRDTPIEVIQGCLFDDVQSSFD